mmetsp:Transcript_17462/g.25807  ORF Transcript_17462/g.25807 Transcript_17462/m.25807 type:complete len:327 (+) Transcript_17462:130-1110(+)|eukprot:CAMPEP_0194204304 /NCGR_PEP_ID=MMETSP0156-20130528/3873_1 /TAXON_ID=33649 /ORGANISM="Thalassionema nitzschioides, Strain L26-B" /LENGTH=326 /DNA_ID=CAMNT_0038930289 /DNA_START=109 /DNA_END=1089 /DNA_ORIENTATION=-
MSDPVVGMMDQAYFTGRRELLDFFNDLLKLNLTKIEETASGAVACQLTDYIYPGTIPMSRVNWDARSDYEFVQNYKLLQAAFKKKKIQRYVDVEKLIKAKYQDNLEFCQWLKAFFDQSGAFREDYDPVEARSKGKGAAKLAQARSKNASRAKPKPFTGATKTRTGAGRSTSTTAPSSGTNRSRRENNSLAANRPIRENKPKLSDDHLTDAVLADAQLMKKNAEQEAKIQVLEQNMLEIETERDFYFEKLRDVEILLQIYKEADPESSDPEAMVEKVFKILYATAEEQITVGDDGEIVTKSAEDSLLADLAEDELKGELNMDDLRVD